MVSLPWFAADTSASTGRAANAIGRVKGDDVGARIRQRSTSAIKGVMCVQGCRRSRL